MIACLPVTALVSEPGIALLYAVRVRVVEINRYPEIVLDFGSDSSRGNGRTVVLCNLFHNVEAGPKDQQDWIDIFSAALIPAARLYRGVISFKVPIIFKELMI
jgi:hypothetical protein